GLLGARVVPRLAPANEVVIEGLLAGDRLGGLAEGVDVPNPAALGDEPTARLDHPVEPREELLVVGYPVEGRIREDGVHGLGEIELDEVLAEHRGPVAERGAR